MAGACFRGLQPERDVGVADAGVGAQPLDRPGGLQPGVPPNGLLGGKRRPDGDCRDGGGSARHPATHPIPAAGAARRCPRQDLDVVWVWLPPAAGDGCWSSRSWSCGSAAGAGRAAPAGSARWRPPGAGHGGHAAGVRQAHAGRIGGAGSAHALSSLLLEQLADGPAVGEGHPGAGRAGAQQAGCRGDPSAELAEVQRLELVWSPLAQLRISGASSTATVTVSCGKDPGDFCALGRGPGRVQQLAQGVLGSTSWDLAQLGPVRLCADAVGRLAFGDQQLLELSVQYHRRCRVCSGPLNSLQATPSCHATRMLQPAASAAHSKRDDRVRAGGAGRWNSPWPVEQRSSDTSARSSARTNPGRSGGRNNPGTSAPLRSMARTGTSTDAGSISAGAWADGKPSG